MRAFWRARMASVAFMESNPFGRVFGENRSRQSNRSTITRSGDCELSRFAVDQETGCSDFLVDLASRFCRSFRARFLFFYSWGSARLHPRLSCDRAFGAQEQRLGLFCLGYFNLRATGSGTEEVFEINAIFFPVSLLESNHQVASSERNVQATNSPEHESVLCLGESDPTRSSH